MKRFKIGTYLRKHGKRRGNFAFFDVLFAKMENFDTVSITE